MKGHMLEMWIFRHSPVVVLRAQYHVFCNATKYLLSSLRAFIVLMIPLVIVMIQIQARYGYAPLEPDQDAMLKIKYRSADSLGLLDARLEARDAVKVETPALRIPESGEVNFRISAREAGLHELTIQVGENKLNKTLCVGEPGLAISPRRSSAWFDRLIYPVEAGIRTDDLSSITVEYPPRMLSMWGAEFHWMWPFFLVSMAAGLAFKYVLGVQL